MRYFQVSVIILFTVTGMLLSLLGISGALIAWGGVFLISVIDGFNIISPLFLTVLFLFALTGEFLEYYFSGRGARKKGATKGVRGALIGGFLGAVIMSVFLPGLGTLIGVAAGTFLGAFIFEYASGNTFHASSSAGLGAMTGRALGSALKIIVIAFIGLVAALAYMGLL